MRRHVTNRPVAVKIPREALLLLCLAALLTRRSVNERAPAMRAKAEVAVQDTPLITVRILFQGNTQQLQHTASSDPPVAPASMSHQPPPSEGLHLPASSWLKNAFHQLIHL